MTAFDFATLASSSLPPVSGDSSSAGASSWNMSTYAPVVAPSAAPARGGLPSFLNRSGIDANRMQQLSHGLQSAPSGNTSGNSSGVSVQAMIHQRRKNILNKLFTDEMNKTQDRCDKMHANRMKKDWEEQKELYAKEVVGDRRLGGSSTKKFESMTATTTGSNGNYTALSSSHANQLQYQVDDHLSLVKKMNKPNAPDDVASIIYDFIRLASKSPSYAAAWKLVYALQQGKSDTPLGRAIATMSHLGRQFRAHVENRVRSTTSSGQVSAGDATNNKYTGMARTVATYVQLTVGSTNPSSHQWAIMYYCLRCGDFVAAKQAMDANTSGGGSHDLSAALETYARQQGTEPFFWDQVTFVNAIAPLSTSYNQNTSPSNDDFEEACWSLLSDADPDRLGSSPLVNTIEDFVYVSMWNAIFGGTQDALLAVGKNIKDLGAGHFQGGESTNSWSYAMPLLLTQQYGSSILHLATKGGDEGVLQATHLSLFLPEVERDSSLLTSLLTQLASNLKARSASSAVEYLVRIPNESQRRTKIVELIVESRQFEELGGSLSTDGVRNGEKAALDQHFPPDVVCDLLEQAALFASRNNNTRDALELLNLANRYTGLLSMLNQQLASLLNQDPSAEKEFWLKAARSFNSWHFGGRRTHAMEVIEANKSVALIDVFRTLLELFKFIERLIIHDFKEATTIVDGLNILPRSSDELQAKVSNYEQMNPVLKGVFPSIVHGAMTALYQQFMRTQHSGMASGGAVLHLKEMKNKASLLTSFASTLDLPYDLVSRMTTMEAQMV